LHRRLAAAAPGIAWLSEESADDVARRTSRRVWVIDPIDGTRAFIAGRTDWAVSAALVEDGRPVAGALFAPAEPAFYAAVAGKGATLDGAPIAAVDTAQLEGIRVAGPKSYLERLSAIGLCFEPVPRIHSIALRFARIARGTLDVAFSGGSSHDWDLAAARSFGARSGRRDDNADGATVVVQPRRADARAAHCHRVRAPWQAHRAGAQLRRTAVTTDQP
jgi:myo-inositol-1(or 4)-monophosphatase